MASETEQKPIPSPCKTDVLPSSFGQTLLFTLVRKTPWDDELCDDVSCKNPATVMCVECSGAFCPTHQPGAFTEDELDKEVLINAKDLKSARYYEMRICHTCVQGLKPGQTLKASHPRTGELFPFVKQLLPRTTKSSPPLSH